MLCSELNRIQVDVVDFGILSMFTACDEELELPCDVPVCGPIIKRQVLVNMCCSKNSNNKNIEKCKKWRNRKERVKILHNKVALDLDPVVAPHLYAVCWMCALIDLRILLFHPWTRAQDFRQKRSFLQVVDTTIFLHSRFCLCSGKDYAIIASPKITLTFMSHPRINGINARPLSAVLEPHQFIRNLHLIFIRRWVLGQIMQRVNYYSLTRNSDTLSTSKYLNCTLSLSQHSSTYHILQDEENW